MNTVTPVQIMRILLGETAMHEGRPLYECLVNEARRRGMAGATVSRGFMGFGANSLLHTAKILRLSEDLPVIVEIVDTPSRIADFLPVADAMVSEGTIVLEEARAIFHLPMRIRAAMSAAVATVAPRPRCPTSWTCCCARESRPFRGRREKGRGDRHAATCWPGPACPFASTSRTGFRAGCERSISAVWTIRGLRPRTS